MIARLICYVENIIILPCGMIHGPSKDTIIYIYKCMMLYIKVYMNYMTN